MLRYTDARQAAEAWQRYQTYWCLERPCMHPPGWCHWHADRRYWVLCGPLGHVVGT